VEVSGVIALSETTRPGLSAPNDRHETGGRANPITFNGCFGWLHDGGVRTGDTAILICTGLNHDALNAHHAHRLLADQLAQAGYPVMRFDYPNTGDSCDVAGFGPDADIDLWSIWLAAADQAADTLRLRTGATKLILYGLRIGAGIATMVAAKRRDIAGLILVSPVIKGQSFLRQIWIEAQLHDPHLPPLEEGVRFQELCFNKATVRSISHVDLRNVVLPVSLKIAMFLQSASRPTDACCEAWGQQGADITCAGFAGLEPLLTLNVEDDKGHPDFQAVIDWVRQATPSTDHIGARPYRREKIVLHPEACVETPLFFGEAGQLFGILCQPERETCKSAVIIVNAGRDPRHGPGRFNVEFARRLATHGVASLRLDFAGLGDSTGPRGQETFLSPLLDLDRSADIGAAIDILAALGFNHFTAYGLCAGAYHAMHAAVADTRLDRLLLVNIPVFAWAGGERIDFIRHRNMPLKHFAAELLKLNSWKMAQTKLAKSGSVLRGQLQRFATTLVNASWSPARWIPGRGQIQMTAGQRNMAMLMQRRTHILLLFGENDLGLGAVEQEFGDRVWGGNVVLQVLPGLDHLIAHEASRHMAAACMLNFMDATAPQMTSPTAEPAAVAEVEAA